MTRLDDPALVALEYGDESRLRRRAAAYTGVTTAIDTRVPLVAAVVEAAPSRVLEVGCGWGELAVWLARDTGAEVVATDLSPRMVELACERGVNATLADVQELPFADGALEFATRAEVEEYVRASISMSPFVGNLPAVVDEPFVARRANSIFIAEKGT